MADWSLFDPLSVLGQEPQRLTDEMNANFLTNVIGNTHLINFFMPLILKGNAKKVLVLTSGMADHDLVLKYGVYEGGPYAIGKAALNMVTSKFQAEFQKDGVLFIGVSPGVVETGLYSDSMSHLTVPRSR
jgi:NAD(P)-dependent dehydrogenase (short-subunit alcohol dehydrogenase family)